jgi:hypothetical protein
MTIDPAIYALAESRCKASGWHNTVDIQRMAIKLQECVEEFEADLENELEAEHDTARCHNI